VAFASRDEGAAVRLGKRFRNRQTEPEPAIAALKCAFALLERIENAIHDFRLDPDAGVVHGDGEQLWFRIGRGNGDLAVIGRELDRVLEQVPNDLLELGRVTGDVMGATPQVEVQL